MRLVILLIPDLHDLSKTSPFIPVYEKILSTFEEMGVDTVDIISELAERYGKDAQQAWVAKQDPHPNAEVHGMIASKLRAYLTRGRLASLQPV